MSKWPTRLKIGNWVKVKATGEVGRIEARQAGCYRVSLPGGGTTLKHRAELAQARGPKPAGQ
jgi:hypothetical protein